MKFLVRDDDTCAMTRPGEIEACYRDIWDEVPVCLSVTPFRIPGRTTGVPESLLGSRDVLPLEDATELVSFLREQIGRGRIDIALHGYHHDRAASGEPEFVAGDELARKAREGRAYLERVLGCRVRTFVPPNNTLSAAGFAAVVDAGMDVVNNQTRARLRGPASSVEAGLEALVAIRYAVEGRLGRSIDDRVRRFPRYRQAPYLTVGPDHDLVDLRTALATRIRGDGVFVLATHYHAFDRRMRSGETIRDGVMSLVDEARAAAGTRFVDYDGLFGRAP